MLCLSLLYSKATQLQTYMHSFFNILFHYDLSQEIGYSSLCYAAGSCCLSILNGIVCLFQLQTPSPSLFLPVLPFASTKVMSMSVRLFSVLRQVHLCHIVDFTCKWYHVVFFFLTYFTQYDNLELPPCCCKWHSFIPFYGWVVFYCIQIPHLLCPLICR